MVDFIGVPVDGPGRCEVDGCENVGDYEGLCAYHATQPCEAVIFNRNVETGEPEERCGSDSLPGEIYCQAHLWAY